jgi:hypothetical protein
MKRFIFVVMTVTCFLVPSWSQTMDFDLNGNNLIDDEEILILINYWAKKIPLTEKPVTQPTPTPTPIPSDDLKRISLPNNVVMDFIRIPAGVFVLNGEELDMDEFWLAKYETTQMQWNAIMGSNQSKFVDDLNPVEYVSWIECHEFLEIMTETLNLGTFTLPNENQWEYAYRASSQTNYFWGNSDLDAPKYAWYQDNSNNRSHQVGLLLPNAWDLFDITGNVSEWTSSGTTDKVVRGGAWNSTLYALSSGYRERLPATLKSSAIGFRVVYTP